MQRACLLVLALVTVACADRTALLVEVSSPDLAIPGDIDALRIYAHTPTGAMFDQTFEVNTGWPHSITIRPTGPEDQGQVYVQVEGMRAGESVVRRVALTTFQPGVTRRVDISLQRSCLNIACGPDVDCVAGSCVGGSVDGGVDGGADGGVDAAMTLDADVDADGVDAEMMDAGTMDAGTDAGTDAGSMDAGTDTGRDVGVDAATRDTGTDTGTDANLPDTNTGADCTGIGCVGRVVISEMSTGGAVSGLDEFVELYNRGDGTAAVGGCVVAYHSSSGISRTVRATIPAGMTIAFHGYLLLASTAYAGTPAADFVWPGTTGSSATGGTLTLECGGTAMIVDRVGYGDATLVEGSPIMTTTSPGGSYERKANMMSTAASMSTGGADVGAGNGYDSGMNAADFVVRTARDPQSSMSPREP